MPANSITVSALQLINAAAQEIGVLAAGEQLDTDNQAFVLQKLQRVIDTFNAKRTMVYAVQFVPFTLQANLQPHTIGPTGTFVTSQRPIDIDSIGLQLMQSNPVVEVLMNKRDKDWWANQAVKAVTSTFPTDYYYEPDWPNGSIFFWPVPTAVNGVLLQLRTVIAEITAYAQQFSMPPGYWDAIVYTLAEALCPSFEREPSPTLVNLKKDAIRTVESNNIASPRGVTVDAGMPGAGTRGADFNYVNALPGRW